MDTPVVLLVGPRQAGKTTLVRQIAQQRNLHYLTLDDEVTLLAAEQDPVRMIRTLDQAVIDEIQRAPHLLLAIKRSVDEDRRPGRFLLTGSANLIALPTVADSLAGRMETLSLPPLSQSEIQSRAANWLDQAFSGQLLKPHTSWGDASLIERVLRGGYPEAISRTSAKRRTSWARQYIAALIQRDVRDIATIDKLDQLPRFLQVLAQTAGQMCNYTQLGAQTGMDGKTASRYISILEHMYLLRRINVWTSNRLNRLVKTPKLQFIDSGLLATLLSLTAEEVQLDRTRFGNVLETFVFSELLKHTTTAADDYRLMYYRDTDKVEVDFIIENSAGQLAGVEVNAAATIKQRDLNGLKKFIGLAGSRFKFGVILYDGTETLPLGDRIWAAPLASLWSD
ncbi:MAG TPA: ATP-binding protein [Castellaniella sp.]|uniref:ATP-binding protein n=1 Tax=Castellaniella sp. TaxID=1955812 RepID=UPI002EE7F941